MGEERQQLVHHLQSKAGKAVRKIVMAAAMMARTSEAASGARRPRHGSSRYFATAAPVWIVHHHVAQRAHAGIHSVSTKPQADDGFHPGGRAARIRCCASSDSGELRAFGDIAYLPPRKGSIEKNGLRM